MDNSSEKRKAHRHEATRLKAVWGVSADEVRYSDDGHWYKTPAKYPAALFDAHGYVLFNTEEELRTSPHDGRGKEIAFRRPGISGLPGYVQKIDLTTTLPPEKGETPSDDVPDKEDRRGLIWRQIKERRGQQSFRDALRKRYGDRCLVTGCRLLDVLEAAHIRPYRGENDNYVGNGLLLRADIHTLFDLNLLGIEPQQMRRVLVYNDVGKTRQIGYAALLLSERRSDKLPSIGTVAQVEFRFRNFSGRKSHDGASHSPKQRFDHH